MDDIEGVALYQDELIICPGGLHGNRIRFPDLALQVESALSLKLVVTISTQAVSGHAISLGLTDVETKAGVSYSGGKVTAYISAAPDAPIVDGLFNEWINPMKDMKGDASNPNVDIFAYDARNYEDSTYFYLMVEGNILSGKAVPSTRAMNIPSESEGEPSDDEPSTGTQEENPLPVETGEDAVYVFLDTIPGEGYLVRNDFYANRMIEIKGQDGEITSSEYYRFNGNSPFNWSWRPAGKTEVASSRKELELSVSQPGPFRSYFHVVSWNEEDNDWSNELLREDSDVSVITRNEEDVLNDYENQRHFFTKNEGQLDNDGVYYYYNIPGRGIAFMESAVLFRLEAEENATEGYILKLEFEDSYDVVPEGVGKLSHWNNYFIGNDPDTWRSGVPNYKEIWYHEIYDGIDLKFYFTPERGLKYDFIVEPYIDPGFIRMRYEGVDKLEIDPEGNLLIKAGGEFIREQRPYVYQETGEVQGSFLLHEENGVSYRINDYDRSLELIIDPSLAYSTFLGGSGDDKDYSNILQDISYHGKSIEILNKQSYPELGGKWKILFKTTGSGTLLIKGHSFPNEVDFHSIYFLRDGEYEQIPQDKITIDGDVISLYWGYEEGKAVFIPSTAGKHTLEFEFGNTDYA
ncbi:MAG: hypothetical protein KAU14_08565, partial [Thermoplasmata archaeon]|nr:hypothetical protein [Thermoplasmata archaeon]